MHSSWNFLKQDAMEMLEKSMGWPGRRFPANPLRVFDQPKERVRVVIIGQDPYPNIKANGLAFAVDKWVSAIPPSLQNIAKEVESDTQSYLRDYTLSSWEEQGVFLLNSCLTVGEEPGSHVGRGWEPVTELALGSLHDVVILAWGNKALKIANQNRGKNVVLSTSHPSPLAAHCGFLGSRIFTRCNKFVRGREIKWGER